MEWMPIETAPAGRCILWVADGDYVRSETGIETVGRVAFGTMYREEHYAGPRADGFTGDWNITHWMPLPSPPTT